MRKMLWVMVALCACMGLTTGASAVLVDNFDYGDGALLTSNGWTAHSGAGTMAIDVYSPGLAYPGYPTSSVIGQAARLDNNGEDVNRPYGQSSGAVYYAFLLNVVTPTAAYFAMLNGSTTDFWARVNVAPATGGMYLGISHTSTVPASYPAIHALNTTHLVVVKYDFATGWAYLWVDPSLTPCVEPAPVQTTLTALTGKTAIGFALRQYVATQNLLIDGLRIGTTWEEVICSAPVTGACCDALGGCTPLTAEGCLLAGGVYQGDGTTCAVNPCPQLGTCCISGNCTFVLQADCAGAWTQGGACEPTTCALPTGSCCALDGTCTVTTAANCPLPATWTEGGNCDTNLCAQPTGSCCYPIGTCAVTLLADCPVGTGVWTMFGVCEPINPCPMPTGACCLPAGTCLLGTEADCALTSGGAYQGNFTTCTPNPCAAPVKTLCEVAEDDMNGVAVLVGQRVTVEGIALCDGLTWSPTVREFQITDGTCCIDIFGGTLLPAVALGDLVRVTGTVMNYQGKTELSTPDMTVTVISSGNPIPTPGVTTTGALAAAGESFESCLFTIQCVSIVSGTWPAAGLDANIVLDDGSGPVTMRIDKDTNIDGSPAPTGPFTITGIGDQYDTTTPYTTGWQIKPRMLSDLVMTGCATGACCFPNGACTVMNGAACAAQSGAYAGDGTVCLPNDCPAAVGACCTPDGLCAMLTQVECGTGTWLTYGSTCLPDNPCEQPTGSCCYGDGTCIVMPALPCTGVWTMFGTCAPGACAQPMGACCFANGDCTMTEELLCTGTGTPHWTLGATCVPTNPCTQPLVQGACCNVVTGGCTITTVEACLAPLVWRGANVPCNLETCAPATPTERTSWGQIKNQYR